MALEQLHPQIIENIPHITGKQIETVYRVVQRQPETERAELIAILGLDGKKPTLSIKSRHV